jgi:hypothetical protein
LTAKGRQLEEKMVMGEIIAQMQLQLATEELQNSFRKGMGTVHY